jgi:hypothetical protein
MCRNALLVWEGGEPDEASLVGQIPAFDRIDNTKEYIDGNMQIVTLELCVAKAGMSWPQFIDLCKVVVSQS